MVPAAFRMPGRNMPKGVVWEQRMLYRAGPGESSETIQQIGAAATSCNAYHLIVERNDVCAASHESIVLDAGFSVGAFWSNYASAEKWLSAHSPDAAILDIKLQDKSCVELAKKLSARDIPFLAVAGYSADTPGVNRIFWSAPWLEKPVTSAGLHLALCST